MEFLNLYPYIIKTNTQSVILIYSHKSYLKNITTPKNIRGYIFYELIKKFQNLYSKQQRYVSKKHITV